MSRERPDLGFADALNDLDLSEFAPKPAWATNDRPSKTMTVKTAEAAGFTSREPGQGGAEPLELPRQRRRRTGRNAQINLKARPETIEAYCALADQMGWGLGETFEKAVELLEKQYIAKT